VLTIPAMRQILCNIQTSHMQLASILMPLKGCNPLS